MNTQREELIVALAECKPADVSPYSVAVIAKNLQRYARSYQRLQVLMCERELTPAEIARESRLEKRIAELVAPLNIAVKFGGDPRGFTVKLMLPTKRHNSWGGVEEGWGVPTA